MSCRAGHSTGRLDIFRLIMGTLSRIRYPLHCVELHERTRVINDSCMCRENARVLETLSACIESRVPSRLVSPLDGDSVTGAKWISVPECFTLQSKGKESTLRPSTKGNIFVRDWAVLSSLQFMLTRHLIDVILVIDSDTREIPIDLDDPMNSESILCMKARTQDIPRFRLDLVLREELLEFVPGGSESRSGQKERHFIQKFVLTLRSFPYFEYPEYLRCMVQTPGGPKYLADMNDNETTLRDKVFEVIKPLDWQTECADPPGLQCSLYGYQRKALAWMKYREHLDSSEIVDRSSVKSSKYHAIRSIPIVSRGGVLYFDYVAGTFSASPVTDDISCGGILCDEMGLGKTVEVIALILSSQEQVSIHRKNHSHREGLCGGTLVVAPSALLQQWAAEINNHTGGSLKIEIYNGIRHELEKEGKRSRAESDISLVEMRKSVFRLFPGFSKRNYGAITDDMIREAHLNALIASGEPLPVEDPSELVLKEARRIAVADVVLTSFDVLKNEIYYDSSKNQRSLRNAKRYLIPDCALLKVHFYRMVVDEAQMIGSFGQVAQMTQKILAAKRWCVTGTPMVSSNELGDLKSLLAFLGLTDESFDLSWYKVVVPGLKSPASYHAKQSSWASLVKTLIQVMWRTDKAIAKSEFDLPPRSLHFVPLRFQAGESELYLQLVEKARQAHVALQNATESLKFLQGETKMSQKSVEKRIDKLHEEGMASLLQLRLACIHPQLTKFWRQEMSNDLQLGSGGTTSMSEVLQRLVDKQQVELQEAERLLCAHLNTLAMRLCDKAEENSQRLKREKRCNISLIVSDEPSKAYLEEAYKILLKSRNVSEKGICAIDLTVEEASNLPEPDAVVASSWSAWRRIQINTSHQMIRILDCLGLTCEREKYSSEKAKRTFDYIGTARRELEQAKIQCSKIEDRLSDLKGEIFAIARESVEDKQFSIWGIVQDPLRWWENFEKNFNQKKTSEAQILEEQDSTTEIALGTIVISYLSDLEKSLRLDLVPLESWSIRKNMQSAIENLHHHLKELPLISWSAENACRIPLKSLRYFLGETAELLTPFKRDTILNQFSQILPVMREVRMSACQEKSEEHSLNIVVDKVLLEESLGYSKPMDSDDKDILENAAQNKNFIRADTWKGRVLGYAYYKGEAGLGYYIDQPLGSSPTNDFHMKYMATQCASKVLFELKQRLKTISKNISGPNEELFESCSNEAIQRRLAMTSKMIEYIKIMKDWHTASANVRLKSTVLNDIQDDINRAASEYPVRQSKQIEKISKKIEEQKEQALELHHKKAFMLNRLKESDLDQNEPKHLRETEQNESYGSDQESPKSFGPPQIECSSGLECPVCLSSAEQDMCLWSSCGHAFCNECNDQLFHGSKTAICPICRMKCSHRHVLRVAAQKNSRNSQLGKDLDPTAAEDPIISSVSTNSDWSIKISALIRRILALKISAPNEKSLVFSQFTDALKVVSLALKAHEIPHVHLYGKSKESGCTIKSFREDETVKVFLIGQKAGAQGLTLVRANHVFLLEPSIDPSIEQQAISRVHRIGQQRPVHIMRFSIMGTIEEQILGLQKKRQNLFTDNQDDNGTLLFEPNDNVPTTLPTQAKTKESLAKDEIDTLFDTLNHKSIDDFIR